MHVGADSVEVELVVVLCASDEHKEQLTGTNIYIYKREATTQRDYITCLALQLGNYMHGIPNTSHLITIYAGCAV